MCFLHCLLDAKEIYIDMEANVGKKTRVFVQYLDANPHFSPKELLTGVSRDHICNVVIESNLKESIEVFISSKSSLGKVFSFKDKEEKREMQFYLVDRDQKIRIENGSLIYRNHHVISPIFKVISLGMQVLRVPKSQIISDNFSTHFTVLLKNIG